MRIKTKCFLTGAIGLAAVTLAACAGVPDTSFGTGGISLLPSTSGPPSSAGAGPVVALPNRKIQRDLGSVGRPLVVRGCEGCVGQAAAVRLTV